MIYLCSGKTGSGKTATAVKLIYKFWSSGTDVWSNTPLFFTNYNNGQGGENIRDTPKQFTVIERITEKILKLIYGKSMRPKRRGRINYFDTIDETFHLKDCAIFFDEGQTLFRNYDWEHIPRLFLYKVEQNRKHGLDLVTTAQRMKAVNINYRELIQHWTHFESLLPEKLEKWLHIHFYRELYIDEDFITEQNISWRDIREDKKNYKSKLRLLGFWQKKRYDSYYDIGFQPLQHYTIRIGAEIIKLHIESGASVAQALQGITRLKKLHEI